MPTTARGFRYPAGSDSPNLAQYIQNLASDLQTALDGLRWVTLGSGSDTYAQTATGSSVNLTGLTGSVTVPTTRVLEVDLQIPRVDVPASGGVFVRIMINGVTQREVGVQTGTGTSGAVPVYLHTSMAGTGASMSIAGNIYGLGAFGTVRGTGDGLGVPGGPLLRYRIV